MTNLKKPDKLLVTVLRSCFDEGQAADLRQLDLSGWHVILNNAIIQSLTPFIWRSLKSFENPIDLSEEIRSRFVKASMEASGRGVVIQNQLYELLKLLNECNIPVVVLKGCHLAENVYHDFSVRPMQDIDILIKKDDAEAVENALVNNDYTPINSVNDEDIKETHYTYMPVKQGVPLEVHTFLHTHKLDKTLDADKIRSRAEPVLIGGNNAYALAPEDLIIYHCFHISYHLFLNLGLRALCDLGMIIRHYENRINWQLVIDRAREWQVANIVFLPLDTARRLLNVQAPDEVYRELRPMDFNPGIEEWVYAQLFGGLDMRRMKSSNLAEFWNTRSITKKVSILIKAVFPADEILKNKYYREYKGKWKFRLYLLRLRDLIKHHSKTFWRLLIHDKSLLEISEHEARRNKAQSALQDWLKNT
ncbi:nucleotidyltransferase family protein [bacterium]|nr:nucleotidyltransferase family protein [bacterium]